MCSYCGSQLPQGTIGFRAVCADCGRELHICRHCGFYKPGAYRDCSETVPEAVQDKARMNFCEFFKPNPASVKDGKAAKASASAKDAFDGLFGR